MSQNSWIVYFAGASLFLGLFSPLVYSESLGLTVPNPSSQVVGRPAAVVNNEPIFMDELERESAPFVERFKKTAPEKEQTSDKISTLKTEILNRLVEEKLLLQEAKSKKIKVTKVEVERGVEQFKQPFLTDEQGRPRSPLQAEKLFQEQLTKEGMTQAQFNSRIEEQIMKVKLIDLDIRSKVEMPEDEETKKLFEKIQKKLSGKPAPAANLEEEKDINQISKYLERLTGEQVRIRHILIRSKKTDDAASRAAAKKKAEEVLQKIKAGEDFAFLAKKFSEEPISKERGGDLGFAAKGDLGLPEIDSAIFKLKEGEASGIIETEYGFHLIKVVEKKAPHPLEYEDISDDLKNYMAQKVFTTRLEKYLKDLRAKANITVNPIE